MIFQAHSLVTSPSTASGCHTCPAARLPLRCRQQKDRPCNEFNGILLTAPSLSTAKLQSRGGDPSVRTEEYDPYLKPGKHLPVEVAVEDDTIRDKLLALEKKYAHVPKVWRRI